MSTKSNTGRARQWHRKSRAGCHECKRRHVKCDEQQPSCSNCTLSGRSCSLLQLHPRRPPVVSPPSVISTPLPATVADEPKRRIDTGILDHGLASSSVCSPQIVQPPPSSLASSSAPKPQFDMRHLVLLHHLENKVLQSSSPSSSHHVYAPDDPEKARQLFNTVFQSAVAAPYLMDQLLALSALHLGGAYLPSNSPFSPRKSEYLRLGAELHVSALEKFNNTNTPIVVDRENCVAMLIFASVLGQYALVEARMTTSSSNDDENDGQATDPSSDTFLDRIIGYLKLHHGVKAIVGQGGWQMLLQSDIRGLLHPMEEEEGEQQDGNDNDDTGRRSETITSGHQTARGSSSSSSSSRKTQQQHGDDQKEEDDMSSTLQTLLTTFRGNNLFLLSEQASRACEEAIDVLLWIVLVMRNNTNTSTQQPQPLYPSHVVMAWPVRISADFIELLELRQPVALVILAHWAVLLHEERDFWVVGNSGKRIVDFLSVYLGGRNGGVWGRWMEGPVRKVCMSSG